ncbi:MAG: endonuclease III [candidate division Zixibacteria bacterium]|nr:endonuclease III [candidate division Zixibacteria bacterium]
MSSKERVKKIDKFLEKEYGKKVWKSDGDPLSVLISTILSQNTSDTNSQKSYASLRKVFGSWSNVTKAPVSRIAKAIQSGGLSNVKAGRIKAVLNQIHSERYSLSLSFLKEWKNEKIESYLKRFKGVGDKTIACVLLFSLGKPSMPVDTHIFRVSRRLNLIPRDSNFKTAHRVLNKITPPQKIYQFHINLITHGRRVCKAQNPGCELCILYSICRSRDKKPKHKT